MKRNFKTLILTGVLTTAISIPAFAESSEWVCQYKCNGLKYSHVVGANKWYDGSNTTGFSWIDSNNSDGEVYTLCTVGGSSKVAKGTGWVQTEYVVYGDDKEVCQSHGTMRNLGK